MKKIIVFKPAGFTLVELIIILVIAAIVGTMLFSVLGNPVTKSSEPFSRLQKSLALQQVMENITADYPKSFAFDLPGLQTMIGGGVAGGNEGSLQNNSYGQYKIVDNHFIKFVGQTEQPGMPADNLLKVTIKNSNNETLTRIFVQ